ncbi:MAG: flagellar hook-basal body complex protein FliE [Bacillota bacterium]
MLSIDAVAGSNPLMNSLSSTGTQATGDSFSSILSDAIGQTRETAAANDESNALLLSGSEDSLHSAMIDAQKAELALQLTVQIRNKILDSYNEIMRMQV